MKLLLEAKNIQYLYGEKKVLNNINFTLHEGDVVSLLGANGCGKTTLLKILLGLQKGSGQILFYGKNIQNYTHQEIARLVSYIPQTHEIPFPYTVFEVVLMGRLPYIGFFSNFSKKDFYIANKALERVGISHLKERSCSTISGGEQQLVYIARSLAQETKILFMDEPVNGLDYGNQIKLLELLKELSHIGYTFLTTTHYPEHVFYCSNKVVMIKDGDIVEFDSVTKALTSPNIKKLYGVDVNINETEKGYRFCVPKQYKRGNNEKNSLDYFTHHYLTS